MSTQPQPNPNTPETLRWAIDNSVLVRRTLANFVRVDGLSNTQANIRLGKSFFSTEDLQQAINCLREYLSTQDSDEVDDLTTRVLRDLKIWLGDTRLVQE